MNEVDYHIGIALLRRLWQRNLISEEVYQSACHSQFFDKKNFTHYAEEEPTTLHEGVERHDDD